MDCIEMNLEGPAKGLEGVEIHFGWKEIFMDGMEMNLEGPAKGLEGVEIHFAWKEIIIDRS